jgi:hypothetical protein
MRGAHWIKSSGGPLICLDEEWEVCWRGAAGSSAPVPNNIGGMHTDYERACTARDYVNKLKLNGGSALILGDMPLETSVLSQRRTTIIRLFYADAATDFDQLLVTLGDQVFQNPIESTSYKVISGRMVIFDSAADGCDRNRTVLPFDIEAGEYRVLTATAEPNDRTSLLLHGFFRTN